MLTVLSPQMSPQTYSVPTINIVLVEPEIPHNTGAIGRLCVGLGASLHLIQPLGFRIDDMAIRRAGLDYWPQLDLHIHIDWQEFIRDAAPPSMHMLSTNGTRSLYSTTFASPCWLVFGNESSGLPTHMYNKYAENLLRIPMPGPHARSINLANAASIVAYEAFRQLNNTPGQ